MVSQKEIEKWFKELEDWDGTYPDPIDNSPWDAIFYNEDD